jgi:hypothetical protein
MHPTLFFNTRIHLVPDGATELLAKDALERESAVVPDRPSMAVVSGPQGCDVEDVGVESVRFGEQDGYQQVAHSAQRVGISGKLDAGPFRGCGGGGLLEFCRVVAAVCIGSRSRSMLGGVCGVVAAFGLLPERWC